LADSGRTDSAEAEFRRWYEFERRWLEVYDGVWTVSARDRRAAIREGGRNASLTFEVPNGVDTGRFVPGGESRDEILYVGSFRHLPNIIGFEKLRREVMPRIWKEHPGVRLRVVAGPRHEEFWKRFTDEPLPGLDPRIEVSGFVEDLRPHYARATVVAAPLEVSAGTNIKVLEAMSCGKPMVTTAIGCAGLELKPGRDVVVASGWEDFAAAVCRLLNDSEFRGRLGAHARLTAADRFSWNAVADTALQSYRALYEYRFRLPAAGD
jgi:glycosyltransferase involved in cell wall biosynthesis